MHVIVVHYIFFCFLSH